MSNQQETAVLLSTLTQGLGGLLNSLKQVSAEQVMRKESVEVVKPFYKSDQFKLNLPTMYRFNQAGHRYYFSIKEPANSFFNHDELVTFYPSVTTIIENTTPMSFGLKKILADSGSIKEYNKFMNEKADYGTLLHILITEYLRSGDTPESREFEFGSVEEYKLNYIKEHNISYETNFWTESLKKDMASLIAFIHEHEVVPIAIEVTGTYVDTVEDTQGNVIGNHRFAGSIDLICEMSIEETGYWGEVYKSGDKKGQPKETKKTSRIKALVDWKSGKSGFFESHEIQLHMYKLMAEQSMGIKIDRVFNVAPKDWRDMPTFSLKDQTDSPAQSKIPYLLGQYFVDYDEPKSFKLIEGKVNGPGSLAKAIVNVSAATYLYNIVQSKKFNLNLN
jgi:hypothetical protein